MDSSRLGIWRGMDVHYALFFVFYDLRVECFEGQKHAAHTFRSSMDLECVMEPYFLLFPRSLGWLIRYFCFNAPCVVFAFQIPKRPWLEVNIDASLCNLARDRNFTERLYLFVQLMS